MVNGIAEGQRFGNRTR